MSFTARWLTDKQIASLMRQYQTSLAHKQSVIARHQPGTAYHTRASRDVQELESRIQTLEQELKTR